MSTQIAIRLPDDLVAWIDAQVAAGNGSRTAVAKCVVSCDNIRTIRADNLGRHIGFLHETQEEGVG